MRGRRYLDLTIAVGINFFLQFFFQWYILKINGAGEATDALFGAMALPQFILMVLSSSLTIVLIPIFTRFNNDDFRKEAWNYIQFIGFVFLIISFLLFLSSNIWVHWILPGFKGPSYPLAVRLSNIQLLAMVFSAILAVLWAIHSSRNNFILIETSSIIANVLAILAMVFTTKIYGIYAAAWSFVLRNFLQLLFLSPILGKYVKPDFYSRSFKETWKKLRPLVIGNVYYKTDLLVDRFLISGSPSGMLTLFNVAQQLYGIGSSIFSKIFINTLVPGMSKFSNTIDWASFNSIFTKRFLSTFIFSIICLLALVLFGKPLFEIVFSSKNFSATDISMLWWIMLGLGGYWIGGLLGNLTSNTFYAKGDTKTPTIIGAILFSLYIPVKVFLFTNYGLKGLIITISVYYMVSVMLQLVFLRTHISLKSLKYANKG